MKHPFIHLILACVVCAGMFVGYGIWYAAIGAKSAAVADLESQIAAKTESVSRIASTRASLAEIAGDEANMKNYFVPETGVVTFINNLEAQGQQQKATVNVLSVSTGGTVTQPTLIFSLIIKGTFDAVMRTVGAIEYAPYDLSISTLSFGQEDKKNWHANLTLVVGSVSTKVATSTP